MDIFVVSKLVWVTSIITGLTGATHSIGLMASIGLEFTRENGIFNKNYHEYIKSYLWRGKSHRIFTVCRTEIDNIGFN